MEIKVKKAEIWRCQFCGKETSSKKWKNDKCPVCHKKYDFLLAQDEEDD